MPISERTAFTSCASASLKLPSTAAVAFSKMPWKKLPIESQEGAAVDVGSSPRGSRGLALLVLVAVEDDVVVAGVNSIMFSPSLEVFNYFVLVRTGSIIC